MGEFDFIFDPKAKKPDTKEFDDLLNMPEPGEFDFILDAPASREFDAIFNMRRPQPLTDPESVLGFRIDDQFATTEIESTVPRHAPSEAPSLERFNQALHELMSPVKYKGELGQDIIGIAQNIATNAVMLNPILQVPQLVQAIKEDPRSAIVDMLAFSVQSGTQLLTAAELNPVIQFKQIFGTETERRMAREIVHEARLRTFERPLDPIFGLLMLKAGAGGAAALTRRASGLKLTRGQKLAADLGGKTGKVPRDPRAAVEPEVSAYDKANVEAKAAKEKATFEDEIAWRGKLEMREWEKGGDVLDRQLEFLDKQAEIGAAAAKAEPVKPEPVAKPKPAEAAAIPETEAGFIEIPKSRAQQQAEAIETTTKLNKLKFKDTELEAAYQRGQPGIPQKVNSALKSAWDYVIQQGRERFVYIPELPINDPSFALAKDIIRTLKPMADEAVKTKAFARLVEEVSGLSDVELAAVGRWTILDNWLSDAKKGRLTPRSDKVKALMDELSKVPKDEVAKTADLTNKIEAANQEVIAAFIEDQNILAKKIVQMPEGRGDRVLNTINLRTERVLSTLEDLKRRGRISEDVLADKTYIRHFVLDYKGDARPATRGKRLKIPFRPYTIRRKGSTKDINTNYIEIELKTLRDIAFHNAIDDAIAQLVDNYDIRNKKSPHYAPGLKAGDVHPSGHLVVEYQTNPTKVMYPSHSIASSEIAKYVEMMATDPSIAEGLQIPLSSLRQGLTMGGKRKGALILEPLANAMENLPVYQSPGILESLATPATKTWKRWILRINPARYNIRNIFGDGEKMFASRGFKPIRKVPESISRLVKRDADLATQFDVTGAGRYGHDELGGVVDMMSFQSLMDDFQVKLKQRQPTSMRGTRKYLKFVWDNLPVPFSKATLSFTTFRENILRLAVYLDTLEELQKGTFKSHLLGNVNHIKEIAKTSPERAAAKVSRETFGDYGAFTPWENRLRNGLMPFYSWRRINTQAWIEMPIRAIQEGAGGARVGAALAYKGTRTAFSIGKLMARVSAFYGAMNYYNNMEARKKFENALPSYMRDKPHLVMTDWNGKFLGYLWEAGAISDNIEFYGLDNVADEFIRYDKGQISGKEFITEVAKRIAREPANQLFQSLTPFLKAPIRAAGYGTYPDVFEPRNYWDAWTTRAMGEIVLDILGTDMRRFLDAAKGKRTLNEVLIYYFSGSIVVPMTEEQLIERITGELGYKTKQYGLPRKGKEREVQILENRLQSIQGVTP